MNIHSLMKYNCCANTDRLNPFLHSHSRNSFVYNIIRRINVRAKRERVQSGGICRDNCSRHTVLLLWCVHDSSDNDHEAIGAEMQQPEVDERLTW